MIVTNSTNLIYLIHFSNFNFFVICYFKLFIVRKVEILFKVLLKFMNI